MANREFPLVTLQTERLVLRPFRPDDAADVHAVWHDQAFLRFAPVGLPMAEGSLDLALEWCRTIIDERRRAGDAISLAIEPRGFGRLVGHVALFNTNWTTMVTEIHYWTAPWGRGSGYATEAARTLARWALTTLGFARVSLLAVVDNTASRRVADAAGFRCEGVLRNAALTRAGRGDMAAYGLIASDLDRPPPTPETPADQGQMPAS